MSKKRGSELLKKWREGRGMTQAEACIAIGCDFSAFSKFETGARVPGYKIAHRIEQGTGGVVPMTAWVTDFRLKARAA